MSAPQKPRGGSPSELTRLKLLWRDSLAESARDYWREQFASARTQADLRKEISVKFKIVLKRDNQLTEFRNWLEDQDKRDLEAERMREDETRITEEFGKEWTLDRIREEVLRRSYARALATGDFASGRKTIVQDLNVKKVALDERKLALLEKKAAAFDQAKGIYGNKELSEAEKSERMRQLFGM